MCTVTFLPRSAGYVLAMNRDEQKSRPVALPPAVFRERGQLALHPSEPSGGTWISLNDEGVGLALINWFTIPKIRGNRITSRGEVIRVLRSVRSPDELDEFLLRLPLQEMNGFRLIACFPSGKILAELGWNRRALSRRSFRWEMRQWVSSGYDELGATRVRGRNFRRAQLQKSTGTREWLRRIHRSHWPESGAYSICMHRADARTVSYTELEVTRRQCRILYADGPPCQRGRGEWVEQAVTMGSGLRRSVISVGG